MNSFRSIVFRHAIQGQILRRNERREVAIFLRDDALWVADFIDGQGELIDAPTWFRFNCGESSTTHAWRRTVRESAIPLSAELVERIARLPLPPSRPKRGGMARRAVSLAAHGARGRFTAMVRSLLGRRRSRAVRSAD